MSRATNLAIERIVLKLPPEQRGAARETLQQAWVRREHPIPFLRIATIKKDGVEHEASVKFYNGIYLFKYANVIRDSFAEAA